MLLPLICILIPYLFLMGNLLYRIHQRGKPSLDRVVDPLEVERQQCVKQAMAELDEMDRVMGVLPPKAPLVSYVGTGASAPMSAKQVVKEAYAAKAVKHGVMTPRGKLAFSDAFDWMTAEDIKSMSNEQYSVYRNKIIKQRLSHAMPGSLTSSVGAHVSTQYGRGASA